MEFVRFGLIVTGEGEAEFLPKLFRAITAAANCTFTIIRKSEQLNPITSPRRQLEMVGRGQVIPTIDEEQYGIPARIFLQRYAHSFVIVIDDLEGARRSQANAVFNRYRQALDELLNPMGLAHRATVHFLVNMVEAYYFAHADAVNFAAGNEILDQDYPGDVETIGHPKGAMKATWKGFDEVEHGAAVVAELDLNHVLRDPETCCWLRSLFHWCVSMIPATAVWDHQLPQRFQLQGGCRAPLTVNQVIVPPPP